MSEDPIHGGSTRASKASAQELDYEKWPDGTHAADHRCWLCDGPTTYRHCKIICQRCGFMRDCSDP